jgi:hypothetical protein
MAAPERLPYTLFVHLRSTSMFDELWSEIQDSDGEIFNLNIPELREDNSFDFDDYIAADYDY